MQSQFLALAAIFSTFSLLKNSHHLPFVPLSFCGTTDATAGYPKSYHPFYDSDIVKAYR